VIIQAYNIDDFAIRLAADQDYPGFYSQEISFRRTLHYPPFGSICSLTLSAIHEQDAREKCRQLASALALRKDGEAAFQAIQMMEPSRAPLYRIKDRYRWRLIIKGPDPASLANFLMPVTDHFDFAKIAVAIDIDPYQLL
jgi:primosomal protein N' (replication factor Y) (superfamily II helicase)